MKTPFLNRFGWAAPALAAAFALFSGAVAQAQPSIVTNYPDGLVQFEYAPTLSITLTSSVGIAASNVTLKLTVTNLSDAYTVTNLTSTNGLTITGTPTNLVVTTPLTSNMTYYAFISATDANGLFTNTLSFDTVIPSYTWEAEDYDYTTTNTQGTVLSGQFFDNPQTNAYAALVASNGVDAFNPNGGGNAYRPIGTAAAPSGGDTGGDLGNEVTSDRPRVQYANSGLSDYDQGWNNGGSGLWGNYTRHYPAGKWNIFARSAGWAAPSDSFEMLQGGPNGTLLGQFIVPETWTAATEYQNFIWTPMTDVAGNLLEWDTDGSQKTLTMKVVNGNFNNNYFMLMPINPNYKPVPFVSAVVPNVATNLFPAVNAFSFTANSVVGLTSNDISFTLNGVIPVGLTEGGTPTGVTVSAPLASNVVYTAVITLKDANGSSTYTTTFGTFATNNYTWEAEDWDYQGGQFFDNPQIDKYNGLLGIPMVDANNTGSGDGEAYRTSDTGDLGNEVTGDTARAQFVAAKGTDYDAGWTATGQWANYTRTYPKGTFNLYLRGASPSGNTDAISMAQVTSGLGTTTQATNFLGKFNVPVTGGYQNWTWCPLVDANGNLVIITNSGSVSTFRMQEDNGGWNANFFMFVPPDTARPVVTQLYPNGLTQFQQTNTLSFNVSSTSALNTNDIIVTLNGAVLNNLVFSGSPTNMIVTWPYLKINTAYSVSIAVTTPNNDAAAQSFFFDTFGTNYYTFEAEDWDHDSGQFFDNPQVDAYRSYDGIAGVDAINNSLGGTAYRPDDTGDLGNEVTGDSLRAQYVSASAADYDVGWTAAGNWGNYTRTYPKGTYNVYLRVASPSGQVDAASFSQLTAGLGTTNQSTNFLGKFNAPLTGGYQDWTFTPLVDANSNLVVVTTTGKVSTFQLHEDNGGFNMNYFMLVPAAPGGPQLSVSLSGKTVNIAFPTVIGGTYQIQYKTNLTDPTWTTLGTAVTGTGVNASVQDTLGTSTRFYRAMVTGL